MRHVTFYDEHTGALHPLTIIASSDEAVELNTPSGYVVIDHPPDGRYDHESQRVDLSTGKVVGYQPPQPSPDHEWNAETKRWTPNAETRARLHTVRVARARVAELTAQQHSLVRRLALDQADQTARAALGAIDAEIQTLTG